MADEMVLGEVEYGWNLKPFAECWKPGAFLELRAVDRAERVRFEIVIDGQRWLRVSVDETQGTDMRLQRLAARLEVLRTAYRIGPGFLDVAAGATGLSERVDYSRLANRALEAAGFKTGDSFTQEWGGELDDEADRRYLRELCDEAAELSGGHAVERLFEWIRRQL